jgi:DNA-binding GntR family transcriptional regulator
VTAFARPKSLTDTVLAHLREAIVSGRYALGSHLSERQLAEDLGVSKTPVRESLMMLRAEGLVTILPQRGVFVFTLSAREVREICDFRQAIETSALRLAFLRDRKALAEEIGGIVARMSEAREAGDTRLYLALDTSFHEAFFRHCGNHYLSESYARYLGKIAALRTHLAVKPLHTQLSFEEHERIRDILREGSLEEAEAVLLAHIARTRTTYSEEVKDIAALDAARPEAREPEADERLRSGPVVSARG